MCDPFSAFTYAAITPARNEEKNLARLAETLISQTVQPVRWVIVENGSTDATLRVAKEIESSVPWVEVTQVEASPAYRRRRAESAFEAGVEALRGRGDFVGKLDADVSFARDYIERLIAAFVDWPALGIASGRLLEEQTNGAWREVPLLGDHCWGPTRTYRRACLDAVLPLDGGVCFTWIDETKARLAGFETATLRQLPFFHHRPWGAQEGTTWAAWRSRGAGSHYLRYRPSYLLMSCLYRAMRQPAAIALLAGYVGAAVRGTPRYPEAHVIAVVRERQRARHFVGTVRRRRVLTTGIHRVQR